MQRGAGALSEDHSNGEETRADSGAFGIASGLDHSAADTGELARVKASHG
jgi:hypothetical protein